jgi:hypothetical protein
VSASRSIRLPWKDQAFTLLFRADAFNILNHTNLGNPDSVVGSETFGVALKGRTGRTGFTSLVPFQETPRQVQLLLRLLF